MNPKEFEEFVSEYYRKHGYKTEITPYSNDYGVDVFALKGKEKLAIQAKMYGGTSRKINRQMVMELHGAKDFFDCTKAVIATDGTVLPDAEEVANKLNIDILYVKVAEAPNKKSSKPKKKSFESIWEEYIIPLKGKTISRENGESNTILKVDWSGIERITSTGNKGKIKIEVFQYAVNKLFTRGYITRNEINQNYSGHASSGVVLILSQVPFFEFTDKPSGLKY